MAYDADNTAPPELHAEPELTLHMLGAGYGISFVTEHDGLLDYEVIATFDSLPEARVAFLKARAVGTAMRVL